MHCTSPEFVLPYGKALRCLVGNKKIIIFPVHYIGMYEQMVLQYIELVEGKIKMKFLTKGLNKYYKRYFIKTKVPSVYVSSFSFICSLYNIIVLYIFWNIFSYFFIFLIFWNIFGTHFYELFPPWLDLYSFGGTL